MPYVPLLSTEHANLKRKRGTFFYLKDQPVIPVSVAEAPLAALDLPLAFTRKQDNTLALVAILSLEKDNNVHVGPKGLWMGGYMPAVIQAHPFAMAMQGDTAVVVIDPDSDWLSTVEGQPLFDLEGNPTELLSSLIELLRTRLPNPKRDNPAMEIIDTSGLLTPWKGVSESLLRIDAQKLAQMEALEFAGLRERGALAVVYAQLLSMSRINRIKNLAQRKKKMAEQQVRVGKQASGKQPLDFSLGEDAELISFDF